MKKALLLFLTALLVLSSLFGCALTDNEGTSEGTEASSTQDPTSFPARGELYDISDLPASEMTRSRAQVLNAIEKAPISSLADLPRIDPVYEVYFGDMLKPMSQTNYICLSQAHDAGLHAICKLDDTHVCTVTLLCDGDGKDFKYVYAVYEWKYEEEHGRYDWYYTYEYYVASKRLSSLDFSAIKTGDPAKRIYGIDPSVKAISAKTYYHGKIAFLLADGIMYVDFGIQFPDEDSPISRIEFFPYGAPAEIDGTPLAMPTAESLPPLPGEP